MNKIGNLTLQLFLFLTFLGSCNFSNEPLTLPYGCDGADYPDWESSDYVLPLKVGMKVRMGLTNCTGSFHSEGAPDAFASDFNVPIGTLITASRAGTVVEVEESGFDYNHPNNLVTVRHEDGSYAAYMHLTRNGAIAELNDVIAKGDSIGFSGATGLAGYPHLHFVVVEKIEWPYVSLPITFKNTDANEKGLRPDGIYEAYPYVDD